MQVMSYGERIAELNARAIELQQGMERGPSTSRVLHALNELAFDIIPVDEKVYAGSSVFLLTPEGQHPEQINLESPVHMFGKFGGIKAAHIKPHPESVGEKTMSFLGYSLRQTSTSEVILPIQSLVEIEPVSAVITDEVLKRILDEEIVQPMPDLGRLCDAFAMSQASDAVLDLCALYLSHFRKPSTMLSSVVANKVWVGKVDDPEELTDFRFVKSKKLPRPQLQRGVTFPITPNDRFVSVASPGQVMITVDGDENIRSYEGPGPVRVLCIATGYSESQTILSFDRSEIGYSSRGTNV